MLSKVQGTYTVILCTQSPQITYGGLLAITITHLHSDAPVQKCVILLGCSVVLDKGLCDSMLK